MRHVEGPSIATSHLHFLPKTWKLIMAAMLIGLILLSTFLIFEYQSFTELSAQYSSLSQELNLLKKALKDYIGGTVTNERTMNGTIATVFLQSEGTFGGNFTVSALGRPDNESVSFIRYDTIFNASTPWGHNIDNLSISSLTDNCTLKIEIILNLSHPEDSLHMTIQESWNAPRQAEFSPDSYFSLWDKEITGNTTFLVSLPSERSYMLWIEAPGIWTADGHYETGYFMTLSMEKNGNPVPFIVGNQGQEASNGKYLIMTTDTKPLPNILLSQYPQLDTQHAQTIVVNPTS